MIRTIIFMIGWTMLTVIFGILFMPALITQRTTRRASVVWVRLTLAWARIACGIRSHVRGRQHLKTGMLVASKHQSAWDTLMLLNLLGEPAFILKRTLYLIPIFGWYLARGGHIAIDRNAGRDAMRNILEQAPKLVAQGRSLVIFPEGTRMQPGHEKPFRPGVARLSRSLGLGVVPVALNAGLFWPKHTLRKSPGDAVLEFLPPMEPCGEHTKEWLDALESAINSKTRELESR